MMASRETATSWPLWPTTNFARRVGGSTYQVPIEIRAYRGTNIALKWLTEFARTRSGKSMSIKLANELIDAAKEVGNAIRKKEQTCHLSIARRQLHDRKYAT